MNRKKNKRFGGVLDLIIQRRRPENDALVLKGHHFTGQASYN